MVVATNLILLVFQLILLSKNAELQAPTITPAFSSPLHVVEGETVTLEWTYNLHGVAFYQMSFTVQSVTVVTKTQTGAAFISSRFRGRITENITESFASVKFLSINRTDSNTYVLKVLNDDGLEERVTLELQVQFKPENVQLLTNITANNTCPGGYWNFTCSVGAANPQVTSYQLLENDIAVDTSSLGMWIKTLSNIGVFTYKCLANNTVGSTISANDKNITVAEPASVVRIVNSSDTLIEGNSFNVFCNASGDPKLVVFWIKEDTDRRINGSVLNFTSINRNDSGTYRCEAKNDCGSDSRVEIISVSYKPDIVELTVNATENTNCTDLWVNFTCVASEANPAVYNFLLYEKGGEISQSKSGMWIKKISKRGEHVYSCIALHAVGNVTSLNNVTLTVNVSASVNQIDNKTVMEGDSVSLKCNAVGSPNPFVAWSKIGVGVVRLDRWLNITSITKAEGGQYQCFANNTCGSDVSFTSINVQFKPENVNLIANVTTKETCLDWIVNFTCEADANPAVHKYFLYENDTIVDVDVSGVWIRPLNKSGHVIYRCEANNSLGNEKSNSIPFIVGVPASVNQLDNKTVMEGDSVSLKCNAMGSPDPLVAWSKIGVGVVRLDRRLNITSITKTEGGQYQCFANNTCGSDVTFTNINVQYTPKNTLLTANVTSNETCLGWIVNFTCIADANPAVNKYYLYEDDTIVEMGVSGVWIRPLNKSRHVIYRCEANNSLGSGISNSITLTVGVQASVNQIDNETAVEGDSVSLNCNVMGFPAPVVAWSKIGVGVIRQDRWLNITSITKADRGQYQCFANNTCGSDVTFTSINVQYPPNITYISANMTVNQSESVDLTCRADGNPEPDIIWSKDDNITNSSFTVRGKSDEGLYVCNASNGIGNASIKSVFIAVEYFGPFNTSFTTLTKNPNIVYLNASFNLSCSAQASPPARYRFYRGQESLGNISVGNIFNTSVVQRTSQVYYSCTPFNYFGDGETKVITVEVYYSPQVTERSKTYLVSPGNSATLTCPVDGNPPPSVQWYKGNDNSGQPLLTGKTWKLEEPTPSNSGLYTCWANNSVGNVTATVMLEFETTTSPTNPPKKRYSLQVKLVDRQFLPVYVNLNSQPAQELISTFVAEMDKLYQNDAKYDRTEVTELREGSVIVSFEVYFNTTVTENEGLAKLRDAVDNNGKLGNFTADDLKVIQVNPTTAASNKESTGNPSKSSQKDGPPWPIIGGIIGAVVAVIIVILLVAWWVHNKRKCRRNDTKIHNSESEVLHGQNDIEDGVQARVNGGYDGRYADSGPPSANGTNKFVQPRPQPEQQQQLQAAAAPPAYAVVDKSKKKKKKAEAEDPYAEVEDPKKDKKTADPSTHDYAVVNKSKKKKKEEDENAYATVDKSKKSKKGQQKPKAPGEVLYADLGDFQPVQPLPTVSTSPEPLAPLKRPPSYQGTEYADITQFLKGNATLPEGQSTEMQPTYANAGGGQEAANKENANTGGEGDIEPKETPM